MAKVLIVTTAALLLAISEQSFAAKRMSDTNAVSKSHSGATRPRGSVVRPYNWDPYLYSRDDPYAPGVNWPGKW